MTVYKNIDGTLKPSFRIGTRGVIIEPEAAYKYNEDGSISTDENGNFIKDDKITSLSVTKVGTTDKYYLNNALIRKIVQNADRTETTFFLYDGSKIEIKSSVYAGGIAVDGDVKEDEIAIFSNSETKSIKTSGKKIVSEIQLDASNEGIKDETVIPTVSAVVEYIGGKEQPLRDRVKGKIV